MLQPILEDKCPCYIFYRLDTYNIQQNYLWIFMSYTPDFAPVSMHTLYGMHSQDSWWQWNSTHTHIKHQIYVPKHATYPLHVLVSELCTVLCILVVISVPAGILFSGG